MYIKHCPVCHQVNYSSSTKGFWTCAYCGEDMNNTKIDIDKGNIKNSAFDMKRRRVNNMSE